MENVRHKAAVILSFGKLRALEDAGLAVVPIAVAEAIRSEDGQMIQIEGRNIVIRPAAADDYDQPHKGFVCWD
jgi:hypothetical protein